MSVDRVEIGPATLIRGDACEVLRSLPDASVNAVITDPPYPEIDRDYGRMTEADWHAMMDVVVPECRRVLVPDGSAVFVLQPNSERVGRMRTWLWEFMAKWGREWGVVQDAYWWNMAAMPNVNACQGKLLRPSIKPLVWFGSSQCYRDQESVLWKQSDAMRAVGYGDRAIHRYPSGHAVRPARVRETVDRRGGVTPFNLIPIANTNSTDSGGADGHGAATPLALCRWWVRYICPAGGTVLDPFVGSGTVAMAAVANDCRAVGIERDPRYFELACRRVTAAIAGVTPGLFGATP